MVKDLDMIMKMSIEEIISSTHSLTLLKIYSKLYLNGGQPRTCAASMRKYYSEIKKNYEMAKEILNRTCVPKFTGRIYCPGVFKEIDGKKVLIAGHVHISPDHLTDEMASKYLEQGVLKKKHFLVLPGESNELKEYTKEDLLEVIEREDFNELSRVGKDLELFEKRGKKEDMLAEIKEYVSTLEN
jgi:hypothetical protein